MGVSEPSLHRESTDSLIKERHTIASPHVECYIQEEEASYYIYLDSNVTDLTMRRVHKSLAARLAAGLHGREQPHERGLNHIKDWFETLFNAKNEEQVYSLLQNEGMMCDELDMVVDYLDPQLGDQIPKSWHFRLDQNINNIFHPQEWVGYEKSENHIIFAQIVHPVKPDGPTGDPVKPFHLKYRIFTSATNEDGEVVSALDLYKFTRGHSPPEPVAEECRDLVPYEGEPGESVSSKETDIEKIKNQIRQELSEIWQLPETERKKAIRRLYLKWHPDKNLDNSEVAEEAFKFLKEQLDKHDGSSEGSASGSTYGSASGWYRSWDYTAHEHRFYSEQYASRSQGGGGGGGGGGSYGGGGRSRRFFGGGGGFTPHTNEPEGQRWVR